VEPGLPKRGGSRMAEDDVWASGFGEYEWCGQTRIPTTMLLKGGF
jgi:hypothetical protein